VFARYLSVLGGTVPSPHGGCILCVSLFLCSPLFASSLAPSPVQPVLLRRSLRLRLRHPSPAPSTSSSNRLCFARSLQATARPRVSGSAVSSSATLIASNVTYFLPIPSAAKALPRETLGGHLFFAYGSGPIWPLLRLWPFNPWCESIQKRLRT
jgi:hypothetical protein